MPEGLEVARRINARDSGDAVARTIRMELIDPGGQVRHRTLRSFWKFHSGGRYIAFFVVAPPHMRDHAYLANDYFEAGKDDEYWVYEPAKKRVRRIAMSQRRDRFLGSDITIEDIKKENRVEIHEYSWKTLRQQTIDGHTCYVVEQIPKSERIATETGYGRIVAFIDSELWIPRKREFWTPDSKRLKTFETREIRQVSGIWTAHRLEATNHQSGHRTVLRFEGVNYENEVDDGIFTVRTLENGLPRKRSSPAR